MQFQLFVLKVTLVCIFSAFQVNAQDIKFKTGNDSLSYSTGYNIGMNVLNQIEFDSLLLNVNFLLDGFQDALLQKKAKISEAKMQEFLSELQKTIEERRQKQMEAREKELKKQGEENLAKAQKFLKENKTNPSVVETSSGLQYKVIKMGTGKKPTLANKATVHYKGTLIDGTVFDESYSRGQPLTFELDKVIPGFQEGLTLMPEGSKFILYIPPSLGYGDRAVGQIPPNSLLIFEVELLNISDK
ncbi:MAG: FKBP-type peptidyl-prolyl cis-trans isomerase [Ignavibacteria bacterium]|nr:FKBP-type peptidyl-prolyl cis-trans isomerase [Ignavibacteria bacterium]